MRRIVALVNEIGIVRMNTKVIPAPSTGNKGPHKPQSPRCFFYARVGHRPNNRISALQTRQYGRANRGFESPDGRSFMHLWLIQRSVGRNGLAWIRSLTQPSDSPRFESGQVLSFANSGGVA